MVSKGLIKKGEYFDSVSLMIVAKKVKELPGVEESAVVMGTKENRAILEAAGLMLKEFSNTDDSDLLIAVKASSEARAGEIIIEVEKRLKEIRSAAQDTAGSTFNPRSIEGAVKALPGANLALISVAGKHAGEEAMKAMKNGLHVMLFSDNVSVEKEIELKKYGRDHGLLVMGPDCGTAIINGVPLAFSNVVNRGDIGVVAASGTGLQEVTCLISNNGAGISQAIGTGGRDVKKDVGGIMVIEGLKALMADPSTKVILIVSKPPYREVMDRIVATVKDCPKPVVAVFLGADEKSLEGTMIKFAKTLEDGALLSVANSKGASYDIMSRIRGAEAGLREVAKGEASRMKPGQKYVRGLFSGGTFCSEAQIIFEGRLKEVFSNAPTGTARKLADSMKSEGNSVVDFGEDEFTVGKPHPMIDFSTRNMKILDEARNPEVAVLLLDLVLGYGANLDPIPEIVPVLNQARAEAEKGGRYLPIVLSVTGTEGDPQIRSKVVSAVRETGAVVLESNADACRLAMFVIEARETMAKGSAR